MHQRHSVHSKCGVTMNESPPLSRDSCVFKLQEPTAHSRSQQCGSFGAEDMPSHRKSGKHLGAKNAALNKVFRSLSVFSCRKRCEHCVVRSPLPVCRCFSLTCSFLPFSPSFFPPPAAHVWHTVFPTDRGQHLVVPSAARVALPVRVPGRTFGSCESQCRPSTQGKCQTREVVFKYRHIQMFISWRSSFHHHWSNTEQRMRRYRPNQKVKVCLFVFTILLVNTFIYIVNFKTFNLKKKRNLTLHHKWAQPPRTWQYFGTSDEWLPFLLSGTVIWS